MVIYKGNCKKSLKSCHHLDGFLVLGARARPQRKPRLQMAAITWWSKHERYIWTWTRDKYLNLKRKRYWKRDQPCCSPAIQPTRLERRQWERRQKFQHQTRSHRALGKREVFGAMVFCLITFLRPVAKESRREKYWPTATTAGTYLVMNRNDSLKQL